MTKVRHLKIKTFKKDNLEDLELEVSDWVSQRDGSGESARNESTIIDLHYQVVDGSYTVVIFYTKE